MLGFVGGVVAIGLSGCVPLGGPLTGLNLGITNCFSAPDDDDVIVGIVVDNTADSPATVTGFSFATLEGVSVTDQWIVDSDKVGDGEHGYGAVAYPPDESYTPGWVNRVDAVGATIPADHETFLVVRLHRDRTPTPEASSYAAGPKIDYSVDRHTYTAVSDFVAGFTANIDEACGPAGDDDE
jgi:hypothetical protein